MLRNKKERTHCGVRGSSGNRRGTPDGRTATPDSRRTALKGKRIGWRESWYLRRKRRKYEGFDFNQSTSKESAPALGCALFWWI